MLDESRNLYNSRDDELVSLCMIEGHKKDLLVSWGFRENHLKAKCKVRAEFLEELDQTREHYSGNNMQFRLNHILGKELRNYLRKSWIMVKTCS